MHTYEYVIIEGLPVGATYSVSQTFMYTSASTYYDATPVYDENQSGTIATGQTSKTVITNRPKHYTWTLTKNVVGAYNGQKFKFTFYFVDDHLTWSDGAHYYYINDVKHELQLEEDG